MSDRELLEKAAKAAGLTGEWSTTIGGWPCLIVGSKMGQPWQPLHDDGDALRLAVKLGLSVRTSRYGAKQRGTIVGWFKRAALGEPHGDDPYAATRRAIVRAAAATQEKT